MQCVLSSRGLTACIHTNLQRRYRRMTGPGLTINEADGLGYTLWRQLRLDFGGGHVKWALPEQTLEATRGRNVTICMTKVEGSSSHRGGSEAFIAWLATLHATYWGSRADEACGDGGLQVQREDGGALRWRAHRQEHVTLRSWHRCLVHPAAPVGIDAREGLVPADRRKPCTNSGAIGRRIVHQTLAGQHPTGSPVCHGAWLH